MKYGTAEMEQSAQLQYKKTERENPKWLPKHAHYLVYKITDFAHYVAHYEVNTEQFEIQLMAPAFSIKNISGFKISK